MSDGSVSFGPFQLSPTARALAKDGVPVVLGNRALDILIALVERAGQVVSHKELIAHAWRNLVVDPGNLRVHVKSLRKALGDDGKVSRFISNVPGQGYSFVAPIRHETAPAPAHTLPHVLARMLGRDKVIRTICDDLRAERFVTLIGPGGMGKTTVAVSIAHTMWEEFAHAVCFVDLGAVSDPSLVAPTIAASLGLTIQADNVIPTLLECLRSQRILLVLDNCEHVVDTTATLAELIFREAGGVHILATSREALRVEGEHVFWLPPLDSPPPNSSLTATEVATFSAVKLFLERAAAGGAPLELTDANAPLVAGICGRLDGIALAIEFAAGRVRSHGLEGTADLLNRSLGLDWHGRRTALPRHQTLRALLDWSYGSLTASEQRVLRRLAIFVGNLSIQAVQAVAGASELDSLVSKSLISTEPCYRLLETTRVYALEKLHESGEADEVADLHARYFVDVLHATFGDHIEPSHGTGVQHLGNVRAALAWCFAETGSQRRVELGVELMTAAVPVFLALSLLNECHHWSNVALGLLGDRARGSRSELVLLEALAISATWTRGNGDEARTALTRGLELAGKLDMDASRMRLLFGMHVFLLRLGQFGASLSVAEELHAIARTGADATYLALADWLRGSSEHFTGNQAAAREYFEKGFSRAGTANMRLFGLDCRVRALVTFARVLWLSGFPGRARDVSREAIRAAARASAPLDVCFALLYSVPVLLWCGDLEGARETLDDLVAHPNWQALPTFHATGLALRGELLLRRGETESGIRMLREALASMRAERQNILVARAAYGLAEGLAATARTTEALCVIDEAIAHATDGEVLELPELLRIKASMLDPLQSQECLARSLELARQQGARSWELRAILAQARLRGDKSVVLHQ
jgi:predicted ATPase/DNA-binding winged helix-turn-helix (wHTH) protein